MNETDDLYELLQIPSGATHREIQDAYRTLVSEHQSDANPSPESESITRRLNHAYEILSDPSRRAEYDRQRTPTTSSEVAVPVEDSSDVAEAPVPRPRRVEEQRDQEQARVAAPTLGPVFKAGIFLGFVGGVAVLVWFLVSAAIGEGDALGPGDGARGRTLVVSINEVKRVSEIRYLGNDGVHYLVAPAGSGNELVALELNVHNSDATRVLMTVGEEGAVELRGFGIDQSYNHIDVSIKNEVNVTTVEDTHPSENRMVPFIADPVELRGEPGLPQGHSIVGWVVFEVPKGTRLRELKWDSGDTVYVRS